MKNKLKLFLSMAGSFIIILFLVAVQNIQVHAMVPEEITPLLKSKEKQKIAYLTFDDGPSLNTMDILDILDSYQVKATFFVKGNEEPYAKESYQEMVSRGHAIALHSYTHDYSIVYRSTESFFQDLNRLEIMLQNEYGIKSRIVRLPGGSNNRLRHQAATKPIINGILQQLKEKGYIYFDWSIDSTDGFSPSISEQQIITAVQKGTKNQKHVNILLHDINSMENTVKALPDIIEFLKKEGYTFDTIDETTPKLQFN
ncbi:MULTISPECIES: polysaccharide deacetylase family protein [Peribacillus]|uniref:polysaccharide deacetylase family protein n=1 Tax=Peribacillus TaxID=2675229 RepID=UPI001F4E4D30|nr:MULTISPECIES: polysaccharide deacetylase family protein [unclassified Peribacillus]MCK1982735.1 polysaccharide deacetylase [Peribacillus sp. Aquil_B1]MCK2010335.1 polysaccharide deacetylase [Peribacillus sp. Aquil_B8]